MINVETSKKKTNKANHVQQIMFLESESSLAINQQHLELCPPTQ